MRRVAGALALVVVAWVGAVPQAHAADRYSLAGGCYAVRADSSGQYLARQPDGGYAATAAVPGTAEPFRLKATGLGRYLLYGTKGDFLSKGAAGVQASRRATAAADWKVSGGAAGRFGLTQARTGRALAAAAGGELSLRPARRFGGDGFSFDRASGCRTFPEAATAASGAVAGAPAMGEQQGTLDGHGHLTAFEFIGGNFHCGRPWSPYGIAAALPDCASIQGPKGTAAPVQNFLDYGQPVRPHDTVGWPTFNDWPGYHGLTYEGTYWKWLERSWQAGLRVMVTQLVDNRTLCTLTTTRRNSCDEMASARLQRNDLYALQDYIDAQSGGPGKGFLRVVTDPFGARRVVSQGKLAVVMGMETSELFGCTVVNEKPQCDERKIDSGLDEFRKLGVRSFFPVHKFDNGLGGTKMDGGALGAVINNGNRLNTGKYWQIEKCRTAEADNTQLSPSDANAVLGSVLGGTPLTGILGGTGTLPVYPPAPQCNTRGLSSLGEYLIRKMMDQHLILEIDHMDAKSRNQALAVLESKRYSGVISAHSWASPINYPRIYKLGGLVTPAAGDAASFAKEWASYRKLRDPRFYFGFGYGSDMNGLAVQGAPGSPTPVTYPFKSLDGRVSFDRQVTGQKTFDYNRDGVAHYGLYADWLNNVRQIGGQQLASEMNRGAEAYLQMWERTEGVAATSCRAASARASARGLGRVKLGQDWASVLRAAGQPSSRPGAAFRWCVKRSRGADTAVFDSGGRVAFVGSTAARHSAGRVRTTLPSTKRLRRGMKRVRAGLYASRTGGTRRVMLVRRGRVAAVGVASRALARSPKRLAAALRSAASSAPVSTLTPPGFASASTASAARAAVDRPAEPRYALCTLTLDPQQ